MENVPLVIWCNASLNPAALALLQQGTVRHRLIMARTAEAGLAEADVAFGQLAVEAALAAPRLRWIHLSSAGYTRYDCDEVRAALTQRGTLLTTSSHVYDEPCAQHVLAMMLALARQLPQCYEAQRTTRSWESGPRRSASYLLSGQVVLLLGLGAIGQRLVQMLQPFDMEILAVRRSARTVEGVELVALDQLERALARADHVVNILPDNASTRHFVNAERLAHFKPGACFYNIGRGTTVDQEALCSALHSSRLGAAYLDVTDPEPLPPEHPLWQAPNCTITPHSAGGHAGESERLVRHFLSNLAAFERGERLRDQVI
jgi:phosphoglycerate dehydrogenase-like enzyme